MKQLLDPNRHDEITSLEEILGITYDTPDERIASDLVEADNHLLDEILAVQFEHFVITGRKKPTIIRLGQDPRLSEVRQAVLVNHICYGHNIYIGEESEPVWSTSSLDNVRDLEQADTLFLSKMFSYATSLVSAEVIATNMGISIDAVASFEKANDAYLSTLRRLALASGLRYDHFIVIE